MLPFRAAGKELRKRRGGHIPGWCSSPPRRQEMECGHGGGGGLEGTRVGCKRNLSYIWGTRGMGRTCGPLTGLIRAGTLCHTMAQEWHYRAEPAPAPTGPDRVVHGSCHVGSDHLMDVAARFSFLFFGPFSFQKISYSTCHIEFLNTCMEH